MAHTLLPLPQMPESNELLRQHPHAKQDSPFPGHRSHLGLRTRRIALDSCTAPRCGRSALQPSYKLSLHHQASKQASNDYKLQRKKLDRALPSALTVRRTSGSKPWRRAVWSEALPALIPCM
eukprot:1160606-Pelagomonas_calceolata.AAC.5